MYSSKTLHLYPDYPIIFDQVCWNSVIEYCYTNHKSMWLAQEFDWVHQTVFHCERMRFGVVGRY